MTYRKNWPIGLSTCIKGLSIGFDEFFGMYKTANIKYAEFSFSGKAAREYDYIENPELILNSAKRNDVSFWSYHLTPPKDMGCTNHNTAIESLEKEIYNALRLGIKTIVIHPSYVSAFEEKRDEKFKKSISSLKHLVGLCDRKGLKLAVEDMPRDGLGSHSSEILTYLTEIPKIDLCFDTNHIISQTNAEFLDDLIANKMHGRVRTIHISDYDFIDEKHWLPKEGINDWEAIFSRLELLEYNGPFMYEVVSSRNKGEITPFEIRQNYDMLI